MPKEGTTLTIPNVVANNVNNAQTYKVYNENDIIGSTSPEIITIPKPKKKKSFFQKLVQVLIIVIIAILGSGILNIYLAIFLTAWTMYARLARAEMLVERGKDYVLAAKNLGYGPGRIILMGH